MTQKQRWESMQARYRLAYEAEREFSHLLQYKYGATYSAQSGKRDRLEALRKREAAASDAIFTWLDANSPRQWRSGCPAHWVCDSLTYEDAITTGPLSVVPPCAYGCYPADMQRFASAVA